MRRYGIILLASIFVQFCAFLGAAEFDGDFAPSDGWLKPVEREFRHEICLNGSWEFQPIAVPADWKADQGVPPELTKPNENGWEKTKIKIPSPWNVNTWGNGRNVGEGTPHPYWPDSVYYPSYPEHWDGVRMAWMKRTFLLAGTPRPLFRYILHFEAVGGNCEVYVNGKKVGENFGRFLPFECDITDAVHSDKPNEILVGVRSLRLYDKVSEKYPKMRTPYPPGSNMDNICGIWQDVYLLAVPAVRIDDVFVKPFVSKDTLEVDVTLKNDSEYTIRAAVDGDVFPLYNAKEPGTERTRAVPGPVSLSFQRSDSVEIAPGKTATITLSGKVGDQLKYWSMDEPNLHGLLLNLYSPNSGTKAVFDNSQVRLEQLVSETIKIDTKQTRFGWREFKIVGKELHLNGKPVKLFADLLHPFGPFICSRDYVKAWYTMVKDMHGNAVRPHAQPHPRIYLELADEMGIAVLDETALFGSSIQLNFEEPIAWNRFSEHYRKLILRDRNHPSVFGWSWGNELFAIFIYDKNITPELTDLWWNKLAAYGKEGENLDPTRDWFSCDGDGDVRGTSPVWNKHIGHGLPPKDFLPENLDKPLMIGEQGGSYYARPGQLAMFNGDRAYEDYRGRSEALGIDVYQNIVQVAIPKLAFFSPAETAWFGLEHLPFGYSDFSRLPNKTDGVFFTKPFEENKPGVQIERLPPYVCTFNPGWDKTLPLYIPLPLFEAQKAAQDPRGPQPWKALPKFGRKPGNILSHADPKVVFLGDMKGELFRRLTAIGVPFEDSQGKNPRQCIVIVDGNTYAGSDVSFILKAHRAVLIFRERSAIPEPLAPLFGKSTLVERTATQLKSVEPFYYAQFFDADEYYFAEEPGDRNVIKCAFDGDILETRKVNDKPTKIYYEAAAVDWSLFNESPEAAKCGAVCLYESLRKPSGVAAVGIPTLDGELLATTIDVIPTSPKNVALWEMLLYGVQFVEPKSDWLVKPFEKDEPGVEWNYTFDKPQDDWMRPQFDAAAWKTGKAGFGTGVPGIEKSTTPWTGTDIWLLKIFESNDETEFSKLFSHVYHDEDVEVYLNGDLVLKRGGHIAKYEKFDLQGEQKKLRKGENVLAVHCKQTAGGQYIDVGLGVKGDGAPKKKEHNLLMDGPPTP